MKYKDLAKMKGALKSSVTEWINGKIDVIFPSQATTRTFLKRGFSNWIKREDLKLNKWMDTAFLFFSTDEEIDSDGMVDVLLDMFEEMKKQTYPTSFADFEIGGGEVVIRLPHNFFIDILMGGSDTFKFGREDFEELKDLLND